MTVFVNLFEIKFQKKINRKIKLKKKKKKVNVIDKIHATQSSLNFYHSHKISQLLREHYTKQI